MDGEPLDVVRLPGLTPYQPMWEVQQQAAAARGRGEIGDTIFLLEHGHVYTNGRRGRREHLLADPASLAGHGASYVEVDRGGDITYHGPGQLVGYPVVDLAGARMGVRVYVRSLEQALRQTVAHFGIEAAAIPGFPGLWVDDAKVAAIGVKVSRGVAYHGFALNVAPDLAWFDRIIPCGLAGRGVTSLAQLLDRPVAVDDVVPVCVRAFADVFGHVPRWRTHRVGERPIDGNRLGWVSCPAMPLPSAR